jgi:hypothetical protein
LLHKLVFALAVFSFVEVMDYHVFNVTQVFDDFENVEVFEDSLLTKGHDPVDFIDHGLILVGFKESKTWNSIVSIEHASLLLVHLILRESLVWRLWIGRWLLQDVAVVRPNQEKFADGFHHEDLSG